MNIEHMNDRNSTITRRGNRPTDMNDLQQALVPDHIRDLAREGSALRAERDRDHLREHATTGTDAMDHPADLPSRRVRLGRWLVGLGVAIAGPRPVASAHDGEPLAAFRLV